MSDEAILETQDVEEVEEKAEEIVSPREKLINGIVERNKGAIVTDVPEEVPEEPELEEEIPEEPEPPEEIEIVVDGQKQKVPKEKIIEYGIRTAQKQSSADHRLEEANRRWKELQQYETRLRDELKKHSAKQTTETMETRRKEFATALVEDEDKAAEMFAESQGRVEDLRTQLESLRSAVEESRSFVQEQRMSETQRLVSHFKREFPELAKAPELRDMANNRTKHYLSLPQGELEALGLYTKEDIIVRAGTDVREYIRDNFSIKPEAEDNPREVKQTMPRNLKKASGRQPAKPEEKPKTTSEIIAEMSARRRAY